MKNISPLLILLVITSCSLDSESVSSNRSELEKSSNIALLKELSDSDYPDNPDVMVRHSKYTSSVMESIEFIRNGEKFDLIVLPSKKADDTVMMKGIALMEFIPSVPDCALNDEYMSLISVVNQEWNRNQVKWTGGDLQSILSSDFVVNGEKITRVDIARNCLKSYLWELFFYAEEDGVDKVFYHAWFDFPKELYRQLFEERNGQNFNIYAKYLEEWVDPPSKKLELYKIRKIEASADVTSFVSVHDDEMYPLKGERKKKEIEIIYPVQYTRMSDFHTDSAKFATFSDPGFYNRKDPRHTQLGRFYSLEKVMYRTTSNEDVISDEFEMSFARENGEITRFIFGGIKLHDLPRLNALDANSGSQFSMGIGNHPFYEDVQSHESLNSKTNQYFGVLLDKNGNWLDSHTIGIDGPLLHLDADNPNILHIWLLSFERHALVGHYTVLLSK